MFSNTGSTESVVRCIVCRGSLPTIAAILFYWMTMKAVQQLTSLNVRLAQWTGLLDQ